LRPVAPPKQAHALNKTKTDAGSTLICFASDSLQIFTCSFKIHPPHQINKTRFGAQIVPLRLDFQKNHSHVFFRETFFQIIEGLLHFARFKRQFLQAR